MTPRLTKENKFVCFLILQILNVGLYSIDEEITANITIEAFFIRQILIAVCPTTNDIEQGN
jgi:hypothetical protein